ncbi:DUF4945 domain-containing protein [Rhodocytophaga rosea]|uniref:DUF4945 domain-containing protein n=1 Tax=Rhodocytophaga rosea TaxID=2704465 RepID=A0A6C0GBL8_9BACT|nr:DUF4945 domain-containing protein [Rhodocytophaga rosea]QHT65202.1 DUF4945 domain-containing protein [Rhodocytophaga rosea]
MKKSLYYILILCVLFCASCRDEDIILSKPGEPIAPVTNMQYSVAEDKVTLTWDLPTTIPEDIVKPIAVLVKVSVDGRNAGTYVITDAPVSYTYSPYDPSKQYRFTVKAQGDVNTTDPHRSKLRISPGHTIAF